MDIDWGKVDMANLQRKGRKCLTEAHEHHVGCVVDLIMATQTYWKLRTHRYWQLDGTPNLRYYFQEYARTPLLHRAICQADHGSLLRLREQ